MTIKDFLELEPTITVIEQAFKTMLEKVKISEEFDVTTEANNLAQLFRVKANKRAGTQEADSESAPQIGVLIRNWIFPPYFIEGFEPFMTMRHNLTIDRDSLTDPVSVETFKSYPQDISTDTSVVSKTNEVKNSQIKIKGNDIHAETSVELSPERFNEMLEEYNKIMDLLVLEGVRLMRLSREWQF